MGARTGGMRGASRRARSGRARLIELPSCEALEVRLPAAARRCSCRWSETRSARSTSPPAASTSTPTSSACPTRRWEARAWRSTSSRSSPSGSTGSRLSATSATRWPRASSFDAQPREHSPLSGGQVDDMPFGGGAGHGAARRRRGSRAARLYGVDPVELRQRAARHRAHPGRADARRRARRRARGGARADAAVRPLRGLRRAHRRALLQRRGLDRPLRAGRRRAGRDGALRRRAAQAAGRAGPRATRRVEESFSAALDGDPEYPHYTRPAEHRGWTVPEVLLSGHHERIAQWRRERSRDAARRGASEPLARRERGAPATTDRAGRAYHCAVRTARRRPS